MKRLLILLPCILLCVACGKQKEKKLSANGKPIITVTIEPQRFFTEAIAGDKFDVVTIVPKGTSPETYDPTPQQLVELGNSTAFLRIGHIGFETTWMDRLLENIPHTPVFDTSEDVNLIYDEHDHDHGNTGHICGNGVEPHIWNSTENAMIIARNTYKALKQLDKENEEYYFHRYDSVCQVIAKTDSIICQMFDKSRHRQAFMIYHPALSYFARDYGLLQISIEEGGKEPSPAHLKNLIDFCQTNDVDVIFIQPEFDSRNAEIIAKEVGARIVPINPLNNDWPGEMINIAKALNEKPDNK